MASTERLDSADMAGSSRIHLGDAPPASFRHIDAVTANIMRLGTLTIDDFLRPPYLDPPPSDMILPSFSFVSRPLHQMDTEQGKQLSHTQMPIFILHQVCSQTFGNLEPLNYEIIDDLGRESAFL